MELAAADGAIFVRVELAHEIVHISVEVMHMRAGHVDGEPEQQRPQLACAQHDIYDESCCRVIRLLSQMLTRG